MTATPESLPDPAAEVVDLAPLSAACRYLVGWYDQLLAGKRPPIKRLDDAITTLQALPAVGGQIGRDIELIVAGGARSTHDEIIGAVERLRTLANHSNGAAPQPAAPASKTRSKKRRIRPTQASLPGMGLAGAGDEQ